MAVLWVLPTWLRDHGLQNQPFSPGVWGWLLRRCQVMGPPEGRKHNYSEPAMESLNLLWCHKLATENWKQRAWEESWNDGMIVTYVIDQRCYRGTRLDCGWWMSLLTFQDLKPVGQKTISRSSEIVPGNFSQVQLMTTVWPERCERELRRQALLCGLSNGCLPYTNTSFKVLKTVKLKHSERCRKNFCPRSVAETSQFWVGLPMTLKSYSNSSHLTGKKCLNYSNYFTLNWEKRCSR